MNAPPFPHLPPEVVSTVRKAFTAANRAVTRTMSDSPNIHEPNLDLAMMSGLDRFNAPFQPQRTDFDWLSRDQSEVDRYLSDPFCGDRHPLTFGYLAGLFEVAVPALDVDALRAIQCPVLLIAGDQDPAAGMGENVRELGAGLGAAGVAVASRLYPGARHELLNETNRDEVQKDLLAWLDEL